ncbi:hypothetical protein ARMSODRAFT_1002931, partial [Armillaria solidipes]
MVVNTFFFIDSLWSHPKVIYSIWYHAPVLINAVSSNTWSSGVPSPYEGPHYVNAVNIKETDEGFASEEEGEDSEDDWDETLTFEYMAAHEHFTLPLDYLRITRWARAPPKFALGIGVRDMDDGHDLALRLVPNEPVKNTSKLLATLLHRLRNRTNLTLRATPVRSKEVGFVFYIATSWDDNFNETPAQRDTITAMLGEINWRDKSNVHLHLRLSPTSCLDGSGKGGSPLSGWDYRSREFVLSVDFGQSSTTSVGWPVQSLGYSRCNDFVGSGVSSGWNILVSQVLVRYGRLKQFLAPTQGVIRSIEARHLSPILWNGFLQTIGPYRWHQKCTHRGKRYCLRSLRDVISDAQVKR